MNSTTISADLPTLSDAAPVARNIDRYRPSYRQQRRRWRAVSAAAIGGAILIWLWIIGLVVIPLTIGAAYTVHHVHLPSLPHHHSSPVSPAQHVDKFGHKCSWSYAVLQGDSYICR